MKRIAVFCGSMKGARDSYTEAARTLGGLLAASNITLVYGGGKVGLMGILADAVMDNGGKVIGIIPEKLMDMEVGHKGITELIVVKNMHERKAMMSELSDAFVCLPGGIGTLEEIFEVYTWSRIGYHSKPCGLINVDGFYDPLSDLLSHTVKEGFLSAASAEDLLVDPDAANLLARMQLLA
ncbi:MAG: TIGR00730 family Rossman fold protein [Bacteroidota bacterium]